MAWRVDEGAEADDLAVPHFPDVHFGDVERSPGRDHGAAGATGLHDMVAGREQALDGDLRPDVLDQRQEEREGAVPTLVVAAPWEQRA
jgi:hypothetical protein